MICTIYIRSTSAVVYVRLNICYIGSKWRGSVICWIYTVIVDTLRASLTERFVVNYWSLTLSCAMILRSFATYCNKAISIYITVRSWWAWWRLKSPTSRAFAQPFVQARIKKNLKALRHWPSWGESTGHRRILSQRVSNEENTSICLRHHIIDLKHVVDASIFGVHDEVDV